MPAPGSRQARKDCKWLQCDRLAEGHGFCLRDYKRVKQARPALANLGGDARRGLGAARDGAACTIAPAPRPAVRRVRA